MTKGIIIRYLCENPSCTYSENKIKFTTSLNVSGAKANFKILNCCPKCKSSIELINFISASVEFEEDKIKEESKDEELEEE